MAKGSRSPSQERRVCKHDSCCERPAPILYEYAQHQRGKTAEGEEIWWTECYNCGYICKCSV